MLFRSAAILFLLSLPAFAGLTWERTSAFIYAEPGDLTQAVQFPFKNTGDHAITIKSLKTSCGCTAAGLDKKTYQPGESGEVTARFVVGDRKGTYLTSVTVTTDEAGATPTVLQLQPIILPLVELKPTLVFWRSGETHSPKRIMLTVADGQKATEIKAIIDNPAVKVAVQVLSAGRQYAIDVTPEATAQNLKAMVQITANLTPAGPRQYKAYAKVK
ncbi:MAG: DUF1573 domain-containing protein [Chthoniobacteraceae bacterium]